MSQSKEKLSLVKIAIIFVIILAFGYFLIPGLADAIKDGMSKGRGGEGGGGGNATPLPGAGEPHSIKINNGSEQIEKYLFVQSPDALKVNSSMTMEAWVKVTTEAFGHPTIAALLSPREIGSNSAPYWLFVRNQEACAQWTKDEKGFPGGRAYQTCGNDDAQRIVPGSWIHIAAVNKPEQRELYINGQLARLDLGGVDEIRSKGHNNFYVGGPNLGGYCGVICGLFDGQIDELRIWSRARTAEEINRDQNKELSGSESGLAGYWKFNAELIDGEAKDETINANHLELVNGPEFSTDVPF